MNDHLYISANFQYYLAGESHLATSVNTKNEPVFDAFVLIGAIEGFTWNKMT